MPPAGVSRNCRALGLAKPGRWGSQNQWLLPSIGCAGPVPVTASIARIQPPLKFCTCPAGRANAKHFCELLGAGAACLVCDCTAPGAVGAWATLGAAIQILRRLSTWSHHFNTLSEPTRKPPRNASWICKRTKGLGVSLPSGQSQPVARGKEQGKAAAFPPSPV